MGQVIWFFGLSGAGKTTLATELKNDLRPSKVALLDGDKVRSLRPRGFTRTDRTTHLREVAKMARDLSRENDFVLCSFITPYEEVREELHLSYPDFFWIWVDCPLAICEKRDVKGLYQKARAGEISHFTGISDPFDTAKKFDLRLDTNTNSITECLSMIRLALVEFPHFDRNQIPYRITVTDEMLSLQKRISELNLSFPESDRTDQVKKLRLRSLGPSAAEEKRDQQLDEVINWLKETPGLDLSDIYHLHEKITGNPTQYRQIPLFIKDQSGKIQNDLPPHEEVPQLMRELFRWEKTLNNSLIDALRLDLAIMGVHPFEDGNGRLGKAYLYSRLKNVLNFSSWWHPELIIHWEHTEYVTAIRSSLKSGDAQAYVLAMLRLYLLTGQAFERASPAR